MRARLGGSEVEDGRALLRILGDVDQHRAGTGGFGDLKGVTNSWGNVLGLVDEEVVLRHGQGDAGDVDFLEGVRAEDLARHVAGDAYDGNRVQHGCGDACDKVGGAGAAGGDGDANLARGARVAVCHVRRTLLVADEGVVDGELAQGVIDGQDGPAGIAEDVGNAFAHQGGPYDFRAGK